MVQALFLCCPQIYLVAEAKVAHCLMDVCCEDLEDQKDSRHPAETALSASLSYCSSQRSTSEFAVTIYFCVTQNSLSELQIHKWYKEEGEQKQIQNLVS